MINRIKNTLMKGQRSKLEVTFYLQLMDAGLNPVIEYVFHIGRRFRFDFAWPELKLAVEIEGGTYSKKSRHTTGPGFHTDCEKYNLAELEGWTVLRFDCRMVNDFTALKTIRQALSTLK